MEEFLNKLYSYENFSLYLIIAIVVLILLFIVILFVGKKDKKEREIETTKKLEMINNDVIGTTFKEENNEIPLEFQDKVMQEEMNNNTLPIESVEENNTPVEEQKDVENDTIIIPTIDSFAEMQNQEFELDKTVSFETINTNDLKVEEPSIDIPVVNNESNEIANNGVETNEPLNESISAEPVLDKIEEKPFVFDTPIENEVNNTFDQENENTAMSFEDLINNLTNSKEEPASEPVVETEAKPQEVFSSVYAPEKEEVSVPTKEELDIELPALKKEEPTNEVKEEVIEKPVLTDYNLDELSGETYTIDK